jgi:hypothetical protein
VPRFCSAMGRNKRKPSRSRSPQPRGGWRQVAAARAAAESGAGFSSAQARNLVQQWAWGFKNAAEVQREAGYAVQDIQAYPNFRYLLYFVYVIDTLKLGLWLELHVCVMCLLVSISADVS